MCVMKLKEYLSKHLISQHRFASLLGITHSHIGHIVNGRRAPSLFLAKQIEEVTNGEVSVYDLIDTKAPSRYKVKRNEKE
jgi:transcriptional regulator with XRE-family HTH domain